MFNTKEKIERRLGTKLFLKAHRCSSPKCVLTRKSYRPGLHGQGRHSVSEFGQLLNEKQKIKASYGLRESQIQKVFDMASRNPGITGDMMVQLLERRLDNVVFRLGLAPSRSVARQLISHGHIMVNNRRVTAPSFSVKLGNKIFIRPQSKEIHQFKEVNNFLKKYESPTWLHLDKEKLTGEVLSMPKDTEMPFDVNMVVDYYSK